MFLRDCFPRNVITPQVVAQIGNRLFYFADNQIAQQLVARFFLDDYLLFWEGFSRNEWRNNLLPGFLKRKISGPNEIAPQVVARISFDKHWVLETAFCSNLITPQAVAQIENQIAQQFVAQISFDECCVFGPPRRESFSSGLLGVMLKR